MRLSVVVVACCLSIVELCAADDVYASIRRTTNIPAEALVPALKQLAHERGFQLVFQSEIVGSAQTNGAVGEFTADEALKQLLKGTGLSYRYLDEKTVTIIPLSLTTSGQGEGSGQPSSAPTASAQSQSGLWSDFLLAQVTSTQPGGSTSTKTQQKQESTPEVPLQEVIVTAQKRPERLQDVPVPVTVLSADTLVNNNLTQLQDYYSSAPGLNLTVGGNGGLSAPMLAIRGIVSDSGVNPTVGVVIDDAPYGSPTLYGSGFFMPNIDPSDLAQVEVLRGPQGTLYGANSLGGLLKYVTVDPSTDRVSGRVQAGLTSVYNGAEPGYSFRGSVNVPLSDSFAVRASGFVSEDPGYIDNPGLGLEGVNKQRNEGGHFAALWRPSDNISLKLSALLQDTKSDGLSAAPLGSLDQSFTLPGSGAFDRYDRLFSATLHVKIGISDITSITSYSSTHNFENVDLTPSLGPVTKVFFGVTGTPFNIDTNADRFSQEIRVSTTFSQGLQWMLGGFYTHANDGNGGTVLAVDPSTGEQAGTWWNLNEASTYSEYAAFTDLTIRFTDKFDVQFGGRQSQIRQTFSEYEAGPFNTLLGLPDPYSIPASGLSADATTYLVTPRLVLSPDLMIYARLASGYRPGSLNNTVVGVMGIPAQSKPDTTQNYEIGAKGSAFDRALSFDASLYYIDWKDIQLSLLLPPTLTYYANASSAKSEGVELSVEARPLAGLTITSWVAWDNAVLTEGFPSTSTNYGVAGDRLPFSSRFSGYFSLDDEIALTNRVTGFWGGTVSYVGDRLGNFQPTPQRQIYPAYTKTDLRAGVKFDLWTMNLFVNNLADKRGIIGGGIGTQYPELFSYITPRTFGVSFTRTF